MQAPYPVHLNWDLERIKQLQQQRFADWHQPTDHQLAPTLVSNSMLRRPTQLAPTPVSNPMLRRSIQLAPTSVSNAGLYRFNSKIRDDCE